MVKDRNKGISSITYNHLNLPAQIEFEGTNNKITYLYNSVGQKLKKTVVYSDSIKIVDYLDGFQTEERGSRMPKKRRSHKTRNCEQNHTATLASFDLEILNFQSLTRPFGLKHSVYSAGRLKDFEVDSSNPEEEKVFLTPVTKTEYMYKFNGKEWQDGLGLNVYDYGARMYMPDLGRWNGIDDKAEKFSPVSPYVYAANNPVVFVDVDGRDLILRFQCDSAKEAYTTLVNNSMGGKYEVEYIPMKGGYYEVKLNTAKADQPLTEQQQAFYEEYNKVIEADEKVYQSIMQEESDLRVDDFRTGNIDIADVEAFDAAGEGGATSAGALIHSHSEQLEKAKMGLKKGDMGRVETDANGKISAPDYEKAHAVGVQSENKVNGNTRGVNGNESHFKESNGNVTNQTLDDSDGFKVTKEIITVK